MQWQNFEVFSPKYDYKEIFETHDACADPVSFVRGGPTLTRFFFLLLLMGSREDGNATKSGPSSVTQQNAIEMAFG